MDGGIPKVLSLIHISKVIQNMASGLTGMICDGGNHGCTMKGIVAVDAAFRATDMAMDDICIENIHGINGRTPEATMTVSYTHLLAEYR